MIGGCTASPERHRIKMSVLHRPKQVAAQPLDHVEHRSPIPHYGSVCAVSKLAYILRERIIFSRGGVELPSLRRLELQLRPSTNRIHRHHPSKRVRRIDREDYTRSDSAPHPANGSSAKELPTQLESTAYGHHPIKGSGPRSDSPIRSIILARNISTDADFDRRVAPLVGEALANSKCRHSRSLSRSRLAEEI